MKKVEAKEEGSGLSLEQLPLPDHQKKSIGVVFSILERTGESNPQRVEKEKKVFLALMQTSFFARQNQQSQLGLIKSPTDIQTATDLRRFTSSLLKEGLEAASSLLTSKAQALNIGGTRADHATKTAEVAALMGEQIGLTHQEIFHFSLAGLVHDLGHAVLSHCGEFALEIALADPQVRARLTAEESSIPIDHEKRTIYYLREDRTHRSILDQGEVDADFLIEILVEEKFGLGIADTLAYLYWDSRQIEGAKLLPEEFVGQLIEALGYRREDDVLTIHSSRDISLFYEFLEWRLRHYLLYYINPETLKIEAPTIEGLVNLIREGKLRVADCLAGTDDLVSQRARQMAEQDPGKYRNFLWALQGVALPRSISLTTESLSADYALGDKTTIVSFKGKLMDGLKQLGVVLKETDLVVVLPTQNPYKKALSFYTPEGPIEVKLTEDLAVHPQQRRVIICLADDAYRTEERIEDKIISLLSREGRPAVEVEDKWLVVDEKILSAIATMSEIAGFSVSSLKTARQKDLYVYYDPATGDYLRLREVEVNGVKKHSLTFKNGETKAGESLERQEYEVSVGESFFESFVADPNLLLTSNLQPISEFIRRIGGAGLRQRRDWLFNQRTTLNLRKGDEVAELVLDRIMLAPEREAEFRPEELEIELEYLSVSREERVRLRKFFEILVELGYLKPTREAKIGRLLKRTRSDPGSEF